MKLRGTPLVIGAVSVVLLVGAAGIASAATDPSPMTACLKGGTLTDVAVGDHPAKPCRTGTTQVTWNQKQPTDQALLDQVSTLQSDVSTLQTQVAQLSALLEGVTATDTSWQVKKGGAVMRIDAFGTSKIDGPLDVIVKAGTSVTVQGGVEATVKGATTRLGGGSCSPAAGLGSQVAVDPTTGSGQVVTGHPSALVC
jgi:hypothetical protein